jgi:dTDP-4-amino-4,6-dideoxygalactose transaminase
MNTAGPQVAVPFNQPYVTGNELAYIQEAIDNAVLSGNGPFTKRCTEHLEAELGASAVLLTHSCTGALEIAALLADIGPGDEVIVPSFTFTSTATAVVLRGATPVFVDVREDTLNIDETLIEQAITDRTRAIAPVHYAGVGAAMGPISEIAERHGLLVMEDAAQGYAASLDGRPLGTIGQIGALSFHETKNVISGEGGALILNDPELVERAEILHEKGTNRRAFFRGHVDKYSWVDVGSSFVLSELGAAFLWAQMEQAAEITARRMRVWERYHEAFAELEADGRLRRPVIPGGAVHNAHLYYLLLPDADHRNAMLEALAAEEVAAVFHYVPLHSAPAGRRFGRPAQPELPVTDDMSGRLLRLPLWVEMTDAHIEHVINAVRRAID